jgi:PAS domain S-box-containing protein
VEDKLRAAALAVSGIQGAQVYERLLAALAAILEAECGLISTYVDEKRTRLRTRAALVDGRGVRNFEYPLAGNPCESVVGREFRIYPSGVQQRFPDNVLMREQRIEGYAGATLDGPGGEPAGLLIVMSRKPLQDPPVVEALLKIFAARVGAELERERASDGLRASEAQYRAMFDAAADSLILRDAEYRVVDVNPAFLQATGLRREDVLGRNQLLVIPAAERERLYELHKRAIAGEPIQFEAPAVGPDGVTVQVEVRGVPMTHEGRPHVLYIGRDITGRKAAEEQLRRSEEQYRAIFDSAADALVLRDADFRIVDVNKAYVAMSGNAREDVIGKARLTFQVPDDQREILALHARALAGESVLFEAPARRRDGRELRLELRGVPMLHRGRPHVLYVGRDITERSAAEDRLRASEEQYREIFNAIDEALVLRDAEFRIVDVNRAYEAMSGYTREEVVGEDGLTFSARERREERIALHRRALAGEQVRFEVSGRSKAGREFSVEVRLVPILYRGAPHVLQIGQEVTGRRRAETERAQLEAQLRQAQKMEAIGHLTGGIAHDFNNILQGILGNLALADERQAELGDPRLGRYLDRARHSAQRARELIGQMLTFSRGQRGTRRPVALAELVRDACKLLRSTLPSTIDLRQNLDDSLPPMEIDPVQVEQVVLNLCINARDAMGGIGAIRVEVKRTGRMKAVCASCRQPVEGRYVELLVRDTGPGIPPHVMDRMFEPFFSTKDVGRGSGMGLSLAHGIVHEHGGHILVDSVPNERTKFRVLLPAPEAGAAGAQPADETAHAPVAARPRLSGRVLVVDDEETIREFMGELLAGWGLEVAVQPDGAAALEAFRADPSRYDLVITDQTMPQLTGLALARELSRLRPGLPVILYTGYAEDLSPRDLREAGVLKLMRKPIEPAQFFPLLASQLRWAETKA